MELNLTEIFHISGKPYPNYVLVRYGKMYFSQTRVTTDSIRPSRAQKYNTTGKRIVLEPYEHWIEKFRKRRQFLIFPQKNVLFSGVSKMNPHHIWICEKYKSRWTVLTPVLVRVLWCFSVMRKISVNIKKEVA